MYSDSSAHALKSKASGLSVARGPSPRSSIGPVLPAPPDVSGSLDREPCPSRSSSPPVQSVTKRQPSSSAIPQHIRVSMGVQSLNSGRHRAAPIKNTNANKGTHSPPWHRTRRFSCTASARGLQHIPDRLGLREQQQVVAATGLRISPRHVEATEGMPAHERAGAFPVEV